MASLQEIRQALADTISAHGTIAEDAWIYDNVEDYSETPAIIVDVDPGDSADFEDSFGGSSDIWWLNVYVITSRSISASAGQSELDEYLKREGPKSIREAVYEHSDLGLEETDASVPSLRGYGGGFEFGKIEHVGAILRVRVRTDGRE